MDRLIPIRGNAPTTLLVTLFRLNGALLATGDRLVADLGLTAARWQVLGVIANAPTPLPIASIARNIGLARQGVRQIVGELVKRRLVALEPNPHHRRASLVVFTPEGQATYDIAKGRWVEWTRELVADLTEADLRVVTTHMQTMLDRLESTSDDGA